MTGKHDWKKWTPCEIRSLSLYRRKGMTIKECAKKLGRTMESVHGYISDNGGFPKVNPWIEIFTKPHTMLDAANKMFVTVNGAKAMKMRLKKMGYPLLRAHGNSRPWAKMTEEEVAEARDMWENGEAETVIGLAELFCITPAAMRLLLNRKTWKHVK